MSKVTFEMIVEEIKREGLNGVKFLAPMRKFEGNGFLRMRSEKVDLVECIIKQPTTENTLHNELYNFVGGYKMELHAVDENYGYDDFYASDFISLINSGHIKWIKSNH